MGVMCGTGIALDALHERPWNYPFVYWVTILGFTIGTFLGVLESGRFIIRSLPPSVQEYIWGVCLTRQQSAPPG